MRALSSEFQCGEEADPGVGTRNQDHFVLHFRSFSLPRAYHRGGAGTFGSACASNAWFCELLHLSVVFPLEVRLGRAVGSILI
jgi:hypothetical protein